MMNWTHNLYRWVPQNQILADMRHWMGRTLSGY